MGKKLKEEPEFDFSDIVDEGSFDFTDVVEQPVASKTSDEQQNKQGFFSSLGSTIQSGISDVFPQAVAQTTEVAKTAINPSNVDEFVRNKVPVDFQRYVRDKDPKYSGISGFFTPFNIDEELPKYGQQFMIESGYGEDVNRMQQNLPKVIERRKELENYVQKQKAEAADKLKGVVQDYRQIDNISDFGSFIANMAGQAVYQIPLSVGTRGMSSYIQEAATVYDGQIDRLAEQNNITREEVIERNLDRPVAGQTYAVLAAALDRVSADNLMGAFRKNGGNLLKKWVVNTVPEALTEPIQGTFEEIGSGGTLKEAISGEGLQRRINETIGGAVGGTIFSTSPKDIANKVLSVAKTGNAKIDGAIDAEASLTPEEQRILNVAKAENDLQQLNTNAQTIRSNEGQVSETGTPSQESQGESGSNLQQQAQESSNTQNQVVDINQFVAPIDKTIPVYRGVTEGTPDKDVFVTPDQRMANMYTKGTGNIVTKYIDTNNLFNFQTPVTKELNDLILKNYSSKYGAPKEIRDGWLIGKKLPQYLKEDPDFRRALEKSGFNGIVNDFSHINLPNRKEIIVFNPNNLKDNPITNEKAQEETRIKEGGENGNENVSQNVQNEGEKGGQNVNQPQKPVGNLQLSVSDVIEQGIDVETENGIKGKLKVDQGGKITLRDRNYTVDLGNLAEVGGNPFESLGLKPATVKEQPFGGEMAPQRTVNEELKSQWKIVANAMTKGVRKGKALISEQLTKVQEMSKQSGMTPRQISAILTRIKNYNPFSGDSGVKLSAFIDKVASDSEYANKVSEARKLQRAIRGNKKNRTKLTVPEQKTFSAFAFIDPTEVDVDEYLKNAQALSSSVKSVRTGEKFQPAPIAEINNYAKNLITETYKKEIGNKLPESTEQMIREIQQNRAEQNLRNRLKKEGGEGFEEEIGIMLDNDLIGQRLEKSTKKDEAEKQLRALANATQKDLPNKAPDIIDLEGENYSQDQANEVFDTMKKIDLSLLNPEQLKAYTKAASKIATNGDYGGAGQIAVIAKKQEDFKTLVDKAKNFKIIKIGNAQIKLSSLPMLSQAIFGLSKDASAFQLYMGMTGISDANDTATQVERVLIDKLEKLQSKLPKAFTNDSLFRRGVYKTLVEYNKNENPTEALAKNKELLERDILTYTARGDKDSALTLERLFKPFRNLNTIEGVKAKMKEVDPDGLKVFEALVDTYKPYAQKIKDYNYFYWNRNAPEIVNYAGKRQYLKLAQTMKYGFEIDQEELEKLMSPSDFSRIGKPKETASAHSRKASVRKDENGNILPEENFKVINLNADGSSVSGLKSTAFEIEALPHMLQVEYNKNDPALKTEIFGYKLGDANAIEQADRIYDAMFADKIGTYSSFVGTSLGKVDGNRYQFDKKIQSFLNTMREVGYTATLGGVSQVAKQSTVLANTATQLGKNATFLFNSVGDMFTQKEATQNFLKGHSVASREQSQSILNIGENIDHRKLDQQVKAMVVNMSQGLPVQIYKKMVQYVGGLKFLTKTDATVAQASYLAFYRDYLDKNNVKFKGWEEEKALEKTPSRREAHAYAKQKVDVLQTASNPAEQAAAIKTGTLNAQIVKNLLIPYGTFALNQRLRLIGDYKAIRFGTIEQKKQAAKDIGSLMVETTVFKGLSWGTRAAMGYGIIALAQAMGAGGDEEDEFEKEQQSYLDKERFVGDLLATAVKDWTPSILLAPEQAQDALIWGINGGALATYNALAPEGEEMTLKEFEEEIGQILPLYQGRKDKAEEIADLIGVFGAPLSIGVDMTKMTSEYFKGEEYSDLTEDEKRYMGLVATMDFLAFLKVAPADIRFAMQREAKRIQRRRAGKQREPKGTYEFILGPKPE